MTELAPTYEIRRDVPKAYIMYKGEKVYVEVLSITHNGYYRGVHPVSVKALEGFPFYSNEVGTFGDTSGSWNCNCLRTRADFVYIENDIDENLIIEMPINLVAKELESVL